jgi:uncharacterized protein (TIGR01244 family)
MLSVRLRRRLLAIACAYAGIVVLVNAAIFIGVLFARLLGRSSRVTDELPEIRNLRRVDESVYASGQPQPSHYDDLARDGFTTVIDLRQHVRSDPQGDDPEQLDDLGLDYVHVAVPDGRAPNERAVESALDAIDRAEGKVLLHCGGGVGRSTSMSAAYLASKGKRTSVLGQLAVGPPTLEQLHFVASLTRNDRHASITVVAFLSRYVFDAPRRLWHAVTGH